MVLAAHKAIKTITECASKEKKSLYTTPFLLLAPRLNMSHFLNDVSSICLPLSFCLHMRTKINKTRKHFYKSVVYQIVRNVGTEFLTSLNDVYQPTDSGFLDS